MGNYHTHTPTNSVHVPSVFLDSQKNKIKKIELKKLKKEKRKIIMQLKFFIPMKKVPTITHQEKRVRMVQGSNGKLKPIFYEGDDLKKARDDITLGLIKYGLPNGKLESKVKSKVEHDPAKRKVIFEKDIPISLNVKWCFGIKEGSKHSHGEYRLSKPDTDNLQKMLKDCMTVCGFWYDDAQVVEEHIGKYWSNTPGIWIQIDSLK